MQTNAKSRNLCHPKILLILMRGSGNPLLTSTIEKKKKTEKSLYKRLSKLKITRSCVLMHNTLIIRLPEITLPNFTYLTLNRR